MKYIHYFGTEAAYNQERNNNYIEPWLSYTEGGDRVDYNKTKDEKLLGTPFTIEALRSGNITWNLGDKTVQYSKNGGTWGTMTKDTTISVVEGDEVQFKGNNTSYSYNSISATTQFNVKGNIMSLTNGDGFETADIVYSNGFRQLFNKCTYIVSADDLKLPATTLSKYCYDSMFKGCTSLTTAPELPATTLASYCYSGMFYGCTNLTTAPELPATTLASSCYQTMFYSCTNLDYVKAMFTTTPSSTYTSNWLYGVASAGTFVKNASATWDVTGVDGIPNGWTVQTATA